MINQENVEQRLRTQIRNFNKFDKKPIVERRQQRIDEAIDWEKGPSTDNPIKHVVDTLPDGTEVYFLKPGKEVDDTDPNPNDMTPRVSELYESYRFDEIWAAISGIGIRDMDAFRYFLVLVYRSAYLLDHEENEEGKIRYCPDREVLDYLDGDIGDSIEGTPLTLLQFLDVLGWNEDVKYHGRDTDYDIRGSHFGVGRVNTLLTCINIPYKFVSFINEVRGNADSPENIDLMSGLDSMQDLSTTGGTSMPTHGELEKWFSPLLHTRENEELDYFTTNLVHDADGTL